MKQRLHLLLVIMLWAGRAWSEDPPSPPSSDTISAIAQATRVLDARVRVPGEVWMHTLTRNSSLWPDFIAAIKRLGDVGRGVPQLPIGEGEPELFGTLSWVAAGYRDDPQAFEEVLEFYSTVTPRAAKRQVVWPRQLEAVHVTPRYAYAWTMLLVAPRTNQVIFFQDRVLQALAKLHEHASLPAVELLVHQGLNGPHGNEFAQRLTFMAALDPDWSIAAFARIVPILDAVEARGSTPRNELVQAVRSLVATRPVVAARARDLAEKSGPGAVSAIMLEALAPVP